MLYTGPLTKEEKRIDRAINNHIQAKKDERTVAIAGVVTYLAAVFLLITSEGNGGLILLLAAVVFMIIHTWFQYRTAKKKHHAKLLVNDYQRKQTAPFYYELMEMFAKQPDVQFQLRSDGAIMVQDNRKKKE